MEHIDFLKTLSAERSKDAEVLKKPQYAGIMNIVTELYPDIAHFIYELLQNAEDVNATEITFRLGSEELVVEHNGIRLFTEIDIKSITSIGASTKHNDINQIGKFGIGFKAVFSYTDTPHIYSGKSAFKIRDLIVPEPIAPLNELSNITIFKFPFNNPKKLPAIATQEIERSLRALSDNTLLFLSHIRRIEYRLPDGSTGSLQRINHDGERIEIRTQHPGGGETVSHWLHFQKSVDVIDDDGKPKTCNIAIAYNLVEESDKKTEEKTWKIVPLPNGQVSIYFPAESETSNLRFHLHAPFASTVARNCVHHELKANQQLRDRIAELVVESLTTIRDQGLLTVNFLAVLPNPADNLAGNAPFYEPIRKAIIQAFENDALTPMKRGGHAAAKDIFKGPASISDIIDDEDLVLLLDDNYEIPMWVSNPPQRNQREDRFLESLDIKEWGWDELVNSISWLYDNEEQKRIETWISKKDDIWLMRFYALLGEAIDTHDECADVSNLQIVRVSTGDGDKHVTPTEVYFPLENGDTPPTTDVLFVKSAVYTGGRSESQKKFAKSFLETAGVRTYDLKASVQLRLKCYENPPKQIEDSYFEDLKLFISYFKKNPLEQSLFKNLTYLLGLGMSYEDNLLYWSKPEQLCLDQPYLETGLATFTAIHGKKQVWRGYKEKLNTDQLKDFVDFLKANGVMIGLKVSQAPLNKNPKWSNLLKDKHNGKRESQTNCIEEDYSIIEIERFLKLRSYSAELIWNTLIKADTKVAKARYRPNSSCVIREADSQLVHHLKNHAWIPNKQGDFCKPQDMTRDDLRKEFPYDDRNGLLTAIGFGENARRRSEEYQAKNNKAQEMGFESAEQAAKFAELAKRGISPDELLAQQKRAEQPEESVPNPDRRRKGVLERSENVPSKESVMRERSIQPGIANVVDEAKAYLLARYTNANGETVCQCCQNEMPFKIGDAYYFEAVQCVKKMENHHIENRLALCPTCAAMYQHARETDDEQIQNSIVNNSSPDDAPSVEIPVILAGNECQLRFVGTHWFDLKTVFSKRYV